MVRAEVLGEEFEGVDVAGTDDAEVAVVEGGDLGDAEAFGHGDDAGVDQAKTEVVVGVDQLDHPGPVVLGELDTFEVTGVDGPEEVGFGGGAEAGFDRPGGLDDDRDGDRQLTGVTVQDVGAVRRDGGRPDRWRRRGRRCRPGSRQRPLRRRWRSCWRSAPG